MNPIHQMPGLNICRVGPRPDSGYEKGTPAGTPFTTGDRLAQRREATFSQFTSLSRKFDR